MSLDDPAPKARSAVTLKDIARHLNLSVTTVARSLGDGTKIGPDTIARVRAAARELGYVRNLDGLRLRTGRSMTMLAILGSAEDSEIGDPGAAGLMTGMQKRLSGTGYTINSLPVALTDRSPAQLGRLLQGHRGDGVIIDHIEPDDPRIALLDRLGLPFVAFGRTGPAARHAYFELDNRHAAHQGTAALIARGFRRPALVEAAPDLNFARERVQGYRDAIQEAGLPFDPALIVHCPTDAAAIRLATRSLAVTRRPDSWVCSNEIFLFGTMAGARDAGQPVDRTGFSVRTATNVGAYLGVPLTAAHYPREQVGWHLADLLLQRINGTPPDKLQRIDRTEIRVY